MTTIQLIANDQHLTVSGQPTVASGNQESVEIKVSLSSHWKGYTTSVVFFTANSGKVYEVILKSGRCIVPHEVLATPTQLHIGIRGVSLDGAPVKTSDLVKYKIVKGAPVGTDTGVDPSPDVYHQIIQMLNANSAKVERMGDRAVITITDQKGTTQAVVADGVGITSVSIKEVS